LGSKIAISSCPGTSPPWGVNWNGLKTGTGREIQVPKRSPTNPPKLGGLPGGNPARPEWPCQEAWKRKQFGTLERKEGPQGSNEFQPKAKPNGVPNVAKELIGFRQLPCLGVNCLPNFLTLPFNGVLIHHPQPLRA